MAKGMGPLSCFGSWSGTLTYGPQGSVPARAVLCCAPCITYLHCDPEKRERVLGWAQRTLRTENHSTAAVAFKRSSSYSASS